MFWKMVVVCVCLGQLHGMESDSATIPDSHLSFIFKEKQKESEGTRPQWDFLSEFSEENPSPQIEASPLISTEVAGPSFLIDPPLLASVGATGPAPLPPLQVDTPPSLSAPNASTSVSIQNAFGMMAFVQSHQGILSTLFNPKLNGNEGESAGVASDTEALDESRYIAQASIGGRNQGPGFFKKSRNQSEPNLLPAGTPRLSAHEAAKNDVWVGLFMEKLKFPAHSGINTVHDTCLGFLVGYDRFIPSGMVTGAVGYNHCKITEDKHVGHGHENQILALFQGTAYLPKRMYIGYGVYGSVNLNDFHRFVNTGSQTQVARSSFTSYTLDPHITFGYDWCVNDWFIVEPFLSNDFFFNFQPSYSETGAPGYNEHQDAFNSGLYFAKPGVNLYQRLRKKWGLVILRQEVAYERAQPMFGTESTAAIVGVQNGISVPTRLIDLNLFAFGFQIFARMNSGFYSDILYRGEWGTGLISNTLYLNAGYFF